MKENDYFLNTLSNPTFTPLDFGTVGLTPDNTSFEAPDTYLLYDAIKNNQAFLNKLGLFDQTKFDKLYNKAATNYNVFTLLLTSNNIGLLKIFHRNDIFAPKEMRKDNTPEYKVLFVGNPHRQLAGFSVFGLKDAPKLSDREIAEALKVWDPATKLWHDSPNDSFFGDFFDTRVLAQYDEDTTDPDGTVHKKGEKKIDPDTGTYYYENLNGRDIYGREVLSKFDTLTTDGSFMNKFDFFDSDDINKSFGGNLVRSAVKVIPAFIPGVAPWYIGARVALGFADVMPKLGKMVVGSNSPVLSGIEGFAHSMGFSSSDHALENAWSMENILNLSSDVFTLLAEQRWLFEYAPSLMKGTKLGFSKEAQDAFKAAKLKELNALNEPVINAYKTASSGEQLYLKLKGLEGVNLLQANNALNDELKSINKLGEYLSKAYMTGVTVADSYGEAKLAGLSDAEAALFTLGYGIGEWGILNTLLGEMILPELRMEKAKNKLVIRLLAEDAKKSADASMNTIKQEAIDTTNKLAKGNWIKNWINKGINGVKKYFNGELDESLATAKMAAEKGAESTAENTAKEVVSKAGELAAKEGAKEATKEATKEGSAKVASALTLQHLAANALGEGVEEVSEEALLDFSKTIFNTAAWLAGSDSHLQVWDRDNKGHILWGNLASRYGLNFIGGFIGGGMGLALPSYRNAFNISAMTLRDALEELVHQIKEGKGLDLKNLAHTMVLGNLYLGVNKGGGDLFYSAKEGDKTLDDYIKDNFDSLVDGIDNILKANNAKVSDDALIKHLSLADLDRILGDLKYLNLSKSDILGYYILDFNSTLSDIVSYTLKINELEHPEVNKAKDSDPTPKLTPELELQLSEYRRKLKNAVERKDSYLDGTLSKEFIKDVLWEGSDAINMGYKMLTSEVNYIEATEHKPIKDIPKSRLDELKKNWKDLKDSGLVREAIRANRRIFDFINERFSDKIKGHEAEYFEDTPETFLHDLTESLISSGNGRTLKGAMYTVTTKKPDSFLTYALHYLDVNGSDSRNVNISRKATTLATLLNILGEDGDAGLDRYYRMPINTDAFATMTDTNEKSKIARNILTKKLFLTDYDESLEPENIEKLIEFYDNENHSDARDLDFEFYKDVFNKFYKEDAEAISDFLDDWDNLTPELKSNLLKRINLGVRVATLATDTDGIKRTDLINLDLTHDNLLKLINDYKEANPEDNSLDIDFMSEEEHLKDLLENRSDELIRALLAFKDDPTIPNTLEEWQALDDAEKFDVAKKTGLIEEKLKWDDLNLDARVGVIQKLFDGNLHQITDDDLQKYQQSELDKGFNDFILNNSERILASLEKSKYIKHSVKEYLKNLFGKDALTSTIKDDEEIAEQIENGDLAVGEFWRSSLLVNPEKRTAAETFSKRVSEIFDRLNNSPVLDLLDLFQLTLGDKNLPISLVIDYLTNQLESGILGHDISDFGIDNDILESVNNAIALLQMLRSHVAASRTDNVDIDNVFGYNKVFNLLMDTDLALIDKNTANSILNDLNKILTVLTFYKQLWEANTGQKLTEVATNNVLLRLHRFKALQHFIISVIPDDDELWKGSHKVKAELNDSNFAILNLDITNLSDELLSAAFAELVKAEGAVHDFLILNLDKLQNPEYFKKIFNTDNFNLESAENTRVDSKMTGLDDKLLISYLATLTAIDPRAFYQDFSGVLTEQFAPMDSLALAVMEAYAFILNRKPFTIFEEIYNSIVDDITKDWKLSDVLNAFNKGIYAAAGTRDTNLHIQFSHHFLVEGIPGAGKSTAVYTLLYAMLNKHKDHDKITKKMWFVHKSLELALLAAKDAGFNMDLVICMDRETYLRKINSNWKSCINPTGKVDLNLLEYKEGMGYMYKDIGVDTISDPPTLVIIDEATNFAQPDFYLSELFLDTYKTKAIITGDYDLTSESHFEKSGDTNFYFGTGSSNFMHAPKLGVSMRSNNLIKTNNINAYLANKESMIKTLLAKDGSYTCPISYALTNLGFYGDLFTLADESDDNNLSDLSKLAINKIVETLLDKLLNVISDSTDTRLVRYLKTLLPDDKLNIIPSTTALGLEGLYYIVDLSNVGSFANFCTTTQLEKTDFAKTLGAVKDLYTYLSRASLGTLLIQTEPDKLKVKFTASKLDSPRLMNLSEDGKKKAALAYLGMLTAALEGLPITENKFISEGTVFNEPIPVAEDDDPSELDILEALRNNGVYVESGTEKELCNTFTCTLTGLECDNSSGKNKFYLPKNSVEYLSDGTPIVDGDIRHDDANGLRLIRLVSTGKSFVETASDGEVLNAEEVIEKVARIRNAMTYEKNPTELLNILKVEFTGALDDDGNARIPTKISYAFKATELYMDTDTAYTTEDDRYKRWKYEDKKKKGKWYSFRNLWRSLKEWIYGVPTVTRPTGNGRDKRLEPRNKNVVAIVTDLNGKIMYETSIFLFPNPLSLMKHSGYEKVLEAYNKFKEEPLPDDKNEYEAFADYLDANHIENSRKIAKLFRVYAINGTDSDNPLFICRLKDKAGLDIFFPSYYNTLGMYSITGKKGVKGVTYEETDEYEYEAEPHSITELLIPGRYVTTQVYAASEVSGPEFEGELLTGKPFVLMIDNYYASKAGGVISDDYVWDLYRKQLADPTLPKRVKRVFVSPPKASIAEWFANFEDILKGRTEADHTAGNQMTPFRILWAITNPNSEFSKGVFNTMTLEPTGAEIKGSKERLTALRTIIEYLGSLPLAKRLELLNIPVKTALSENLYKDTEGNIKLTKESFLWKLRDKNSAIYLGEETLYNVLNDSLRFFVTRLNREGSNPDTVNLHNLDASNADTLIIKARIDRIIKDLNNPELNKGFVGKDGKVITKDITIPEIFYRLPYQPVTSSENKDIKLSPSSRAIIVPLQVADDYTYKGKPLLILGKLDTTLLQMDIEPFLDLIIDLHGNTGKALNLKIAYETKWDSTKTPIPTIWDDFDAGIPKVIKDSLKDNEDPSEEEFAKTAWENGYFIIKSNLPGGGVRYKVRTSESGGPIFLEGSKVLIIKAFNDNLSPTVISESGIVTLGNGDKYNFDITANTLTFINPDTPPVEETTTKITKYEDNKDLLQLVRAIFGGNSRIITEVFEGESVPAWNSKQVVMLLKALNDPDKGILSVINDHISDFDPDSEDLKIFKDTAHGNELLLALVKFKERIDADPESDEILTRKDLSPNALATLDAINKKFNNNIEIPIKTC